MLRMRSHARSTSSPHPLSSNSQIRITLHGRPKHQPRKRDRPGGVQRLPALLRDDRLDRVDDALVRLLVF